MKQLEQVVRDVRGFATEVRRLGYSSVANGHENQFLDLSERMSRFADEVDSPPVTELGPPEARADAK
jgi:hypothetical protein